MISNTNLYWQFSKTHQHVAFNISKINLLLSSRIGQYWGGSSPRIWISLIHIRALTFFFPKWGHMLFNYYYFWFWLILCVKGVLSNIGKNALCRKNGQFWSILTWNRVVIGIYKSNNTEIWSGDSFGYVPKKWCGDFWNFDFPPINQLDQNLDFDPLKNREKSKFQKSSRHFFVSSSKLSPDQISALLDL